MTNTTSLWLGGLILGALVLDFAVFGGENTLFLGRKLLELVDWVAFWR